MSGLDVAIVGAGPAGLATALFLVDREPSLAGRVAVFERATLPRDKPCAGALGGRGEKLLASVGVGVEAIPHTRFDRAHFARYMDSSLEFEVVYFVTTNDYLIYMDTQQQVNLELLQRFNAEGIQFAFPTRRVIHTTTDGAPVTDTTRAGGDAAAG